MRYKFGEIITKRRVEIYFFSAGIMVAMMLIMGGL